jgi:DNA polymerase III gamma/tau subunit
MSIDEFSKKELMELQRTIDLDDLIEERKKKMPESLTLLTKFRPTDFDQCIGNREAIKRLAEEVSGPNCPHTFLFTGPSGVGKTTLARIIASKVKATIDEIDAASYSGVDDTRRIVEMTEFQPLELETGKPNRLIIIDEVHALSKQAFQPLLKLTEQPPPYVFIALATTEANKVPDTIKTRAYPVTLKPVKPQEISDLLTIVSELEGWTVNGDVLNAIILAAEGSPRMALNLLQAGHAAQTRDELAQIVSKVTSDQSPAIALIRYLMTGQKNWKAVSQYLDKIEDFDTALFDTSAYLASALIRSEERQSHDIWLMLEKFTSYSMWDKRVQYLVAIGRILWGTIPF